VKKKERASARTATKQAVKKRTAGLPKAVAAGSSSVDSTLLIGGLALVVLVLGDTIFLALSARFLRPS
jgi:hypothetical protein